MPDSCGNKSTITTTTDYHQIKKETSKVTKESINITHFRKTLPTKNNRRPSPANLKLKKQFKKPPHHGTIQIKTNASIIFNNNSDFNNFQSKTNTSDRPRRVSRCKSYLQTKIVSVDQLITIEHCYRNEESCYPYEETIFQLPANG